MPRSDVARTQLRNALRRAVKRLDAAPSTATPSAARNRTSTAAGPAGRDAQDDFFRVLAKTGDLGSAAIATTRTMLRRDRRGQARTFAQALQNESGAVRRSGDICMAMTAVADGMPDAAWGLFTGAGLRDVVRLAPAEYLRTAFGQEPEQAGEALERLLSGRYETDADATAWLDIAATSFMAAREELSREALERAVAESNQMADDVARDRLRADARWLQEWYGRRSEVPESELPALAVLGCRGPDRLSSSRNVADYLEPLATLGQLARHPDFVVAPDQQERAGATFGSLVSNLQARTGTKPRATDATARLFAVDRDAFRWARVPTGTWVIYTGVLPHPQFGVRGDLPLDDRFRPIFLSVHVDSSSALPEAAIEYLREHAPIGCRDWSTVLLLQAAGVPAFFAGSVLATLHDIAGPRAFGTRAHRVDARRGTDVEVSEYSDAVRRRELPDNLRAALEHVDGLASVDQVRSDELQTYLAARTLGVPVKYKPANRAERKLWGLLDLDDAALESMRCGITNKLAAVCSAILAGKPEAEVYAAWRGVCADDVERADDFRANVAPLPAPTIDVAAACASIRAAMVTVGRTQPGGTGSEINVELSLDGNYKHQLEVVLDSIVRNTARPVRAFVLCREHTRADFDRMAALFPEVSFVWLPTDGVDYGPIRGLLHYTTVTTMDRLLLPDLLPEISRIVHHDLDALCLADLGELHDVDLDGMPLAAVKSPQRNRQSGFGKLMDRSESFRNDPERGHEYLLRTHTRHRFDYDILNAGIVTLDLDVMRADDFCRNFLPYVERFGLNDQAVLNDYAGPNRVELDPGWNWRPWLETVSDPKIAHWAGPQKPWKENWVVGRDLWRAGEARVAARYLRVADAARMPTMRKLAVSSRP
jgi:lipopolysaccharide biosynthesis glycosyltransferase